LPPAPPQLAPEESFRQGNYAAAARADDARWEKFAAVGLVGLARPALEGLARFDGPEPAFYAAVTRWIDGDDDGAARGLEPLAAGHAHARRLLALIRKPRLRVLAQLPWTRTGCSDLITGCKGDAKFQVENISFHPDDLPNAPHADVHQFYSPDDPPDFYVCQMIEWHALPPNLAELPCPVLGQTADYDLHIQVVQPWLGLFDELLVTDSSEWADVRRLVAAPVSTFPKSFALPANLPAMPAGARAWDLFLSGTVTHAYHPDKAILLQQILRVPGARLRVVNGFRTQDKYHVCVGGSKVCVTYVRHPTATPTRGLEALALGCALVVQRGSVVTLYVGEAEGVRTYDLAAGDLTATVRDTLDRWPEHSRRAARGAEVVRREFSLARVASQYLRFLTFLAARPRPGRPARPPERLYQKRPILQTGWLPEYDFSRGLTLKRLGLASHARLMDAIESGPPDSRLFIDAARESVLYNAHRVRGRDFPAAEWLAAIAALYRRGVRACPRSLVLRFNGARTLLHFGGAAEHAEALALIDETLAFPEESWPVGLMEDVFPWDFFAQLFNYRRYFDRLMAALVEGINVEAELRRLILASLHYYRGLLAPYGHFHSEGLGHFRHAMRLVPDFPYYQYHYARELLQRGLPEDDAEACALLGRLLDGSILFIEAFDLLEGLAAGERPPLETYDTLRPTTLVKKVAASQPPLPPAAGVADEVRRMVETARPFVTRARGQIDFVESISPERNRLDLQPSPRLRDDQYTPAAVLQELDRLRQLVRGMESSKFWKLRTAWFKCKRLLGLAGRN
jgi:hypothetical protein